MHRRRECAPVWEDHRRTTPFHPPAAADPATEMLLRLQASAGNAAVGRLVSGSVTVQRFWPFDDDEEDEGEAASEEPAPAEDGGFTPSDETDGGASGSDGGWTDESGYIPSDETDEGSDESQEPDGGDLIGPGGVWGEEEDAGGEGNLMGGSPEEQWTAAVDEGNYEEALSIVLSTHGFGGDYVYDIWYNPNEAHAAEAGGPLGTAQWISVGQDAFTGGYAYCVSVIGHEFEHAKQRAGTEVGPPDEQNPDDRSPKPIEDANVREFLSYSWEVLDSPVRLSDDLLYAMCHQALKAYGQMDAMAQAYYLERKDRVVAVQRTLPVPQLQSAE